MIYIQQRAEKHKQEKDSKFSAGINQHISRFIRAKDKARKQNRRKQAFLMTSEMQTRPHYSTVPPKCCDTARLVRQGGFSLTSIPCHGKPGHRVDKKGEKTCFVLDFSNHQENIPFSSVACHWGMKRFMPEEGTWTTGNTICAACADPGRDLGMGRPLLSAQSGCTAMCKEAPGCWASAVLFREGSECSSLLLVLPWPCWRFTHHAKTLSLCSTVVQALHVARSILK